MNSHIGPLREKIDEFPRSAGVYIMKDSRERIIYIGKAVDIRSRIKTYLDQQDERYQIPALLSAVRTIDWIATSNESEALILEANLVRKHKPRYNVDLKDDKHYPYLKVTLNEKFPRLIVVRRIVPDKARYFGPYTDTAAMRQIMSQAKKAFKLCDCTRAIQARPKGRPCINYSIGRCSGACAGKISPDDYRANIELLIHLLQGHRSEVIAELEKRMDRAVADLDFEHAAEFRDQIALVRQGSRTQKVDLQAERIDRDVFGACDNGSTACLCVLCFRQGVLLHTRRFLIPFPQWEYSQGSRERLIVQFYGDSAAAPPEDILLPEDLAVDTGLLERYLGNQYSRQIHIGVPQKGRKHELVAMARENARLYLMQKPGPEMRDELRILQKELGLPRYPRSIEAFDISNLGYSHAVGAQVRFDDGLPEKSQYRRYRIKTVDRQDDFAMIMEVVGRRLARLELAKEPFPELFLIDGGKGQLHAAQKALAHYDNPPMIISLAKKNEELYSPYIKNAIQLNSSNPARKLVQRIRDEVHRFAIGYHRTVRDRQFSRSRLEDIPGVGKKRAQALLRHFGSLQELAQATVEQIAGTQGIPESIAQRIKDAGQEK